MSPIPSDRARSRDNSLKIVIAGAGIGGLTLAARLALLGHEVSVFEARSEASARSEGAFLTLAPNGMNGLRLVGSHDAVIEGGIDTIGIELRGSTGKCLSLADQSDHATVFGAPSVTIGRGKLLSILLDQARALGVEPRFGSAVVAVDEQPDSVAVGLADGSSVTADLLVAADGLRSTVRMLVFPYLPKPSFTGLIGCGGMVDVDIPPTNGLMRMTFGRDAFFGYLREQHGPVYWFNSYPAAEREAGRIDDPRAYVRHIARLHSEDPAPNAAIIAAVEAIDRHYPIYDMPTLETWHSDRVVLLGDAAHAIGPHTGQGASTAIEDAIVLTACLDRTEQLRDGLAMYESQRRERIERIAQLTRSMGQQKRVSNPFALWLRDLILPIFIPLGIKAGRKLLEYRVDRDPLVA